METAIFIDNLKCGGCANTIKKGLSALTGVQNVVVDVEKEQVNVSYTNETILSDIKHKLSHMGYPEKGSLSGIDKLAAGAKSYVSCAIGKFSENK
ncbi:MAG: heavy metal-associated domain-containing protein [Sediminibacterium sp.]|nr:heavy metal-associated domain-containing protein [Sediminibacterium sp.]